MYRKKIYSEFFPLVNSFSHTHTYKKIRKDDDGAYKIYLPDFQNSLKSREKRSKNQQLVRSLFEQYFKDKKNIEKCRKNRWKLLREEYIYSCIHVCVYINIYMYF